MKNILPILQKALPLLQRYAVILCFIAIAGAYGYIVVNASKQASLEPSETDINEQFQGASRPRLDPAIADRLQQLEAQNIEIQAIFNEARNNPFSE